MSLTKTDLDQFTATQHYWRHWTGKIVCTDGVTYLADRAQASWLIDAIASYQTRTFLKDSMLQQFQAWKLTVNPNHTAILVCERDMNDVVLTQDIYFTDFPLEDITLYLVLGVLMLPSEY
jgi:hypothetical protein